MPKFLVVYSVSVIVEAKDKDEAYKKLKEVEKHISGIPGVVDIMQLTRLWEEDE